jgi:hypothetical protein
VVMAYLNELIEQVNVPGTVSQIYRRSARLESFCLRKRNNNDFLYRLQ